MVLISDRQRVHVDFISQKWTPVYIIFKRGQIKFSHKIEKK